MDTTNTRSAVQITTALCLTHHATTLPYPLVSQERNLLKLPKKKLYTFPWSTFRRRNLEQSIGMRVSAPQVDTIIMIETIHPS